MLLEHTKKAMRKMNREPDFWKDIYSKAKPADLETLNLPMNFLELSIEQKRAIESVFYPDDYEEQKSEAVDAAKEAIRVLKSAVWEIESAINQLEEIV